MFKNFDKIEVLDQNQHPMIAPDVSVTLEEDGKLTVFGGDTKIGYIRLEKTCSLFDQATVLGDAWERGYAEFCWKKADFSRILPWYFAAQRDGKVFCVGVKTQPNAFCAWQCGENKLVLTADVRNGSDGLSLNGRTLEVCTVVSKEYSCTAFSALCDFCKMLCPNPRLPGKPIYGGNDWYCNYGNNTYEKIMMHTRRIMECAPKNGNPCTECRKEKRCFVIMIWGLTSTILTEVRGNTAMRNSAIWKSSQRKSSSLAQFRGFGFDRFGRWKKCRMKSS